MKRQKRNVCFVTYRRTKWKNSINRFFESFSFRVDLRFNDTAYGSQMCAFACTTCYNMSQNDRSMVRLLGWLTLALALLGAPAAQAQSVSFGGSIGANIGSVTTSDDLATGIRTGVSLGGVMHLDLPGPLGLQPELAITEKSTAITEGVGQTNYSAWYLEVPLQLRADLFSIWELDLFALAGGSYGLKLFENQSIGGTLEAQIPSSETFYTRSDISGLVGIGATLDEGPTPLSVFIRYMHGFENISQGRAAPTEPENNPFVQNPFPQNASMRAVMIGVYLGI